MHGGTTDPKQKTAPHTKSLSPLAKGLPSKLREASKGKYSLCIQRSSQDFGRVISVLLTMLQHKLRLGLIGGENSFMGETHRRRPGRCWTIPTPTFRPLLSPFSVQHEIGCPQMGRRMHPPDKAFLLKRPQIAGGRVG